MPSFDHPWILWCGLPLVAAPLVIHLISLWRHRVVRWAAMEFLLAGQRRSRMRVLLRQLLLLAIRTAVVLGLVLALAQPRWRQPLGLFGGAAAHLVVLDDSYSMGDRSGAAAPATAFDRGAAVAERLAGELATLPGRNEIAVAVSSDLATTPAAAVAWQTAAPEALPAVRDAIARVRVSSGTAGCRAAVDAAADACRLEAGRRSVLWLVGDHRDRDWQDAAPVAERLARLADGGVEIRIVDVAADAAGAGVGNLGITRLEQVGGVPAAGVLLPLEVEVRNHGPDAAHDVVVELREDGGARPAVRIESIAAGQAAVRRFDVRFPGAGSHVVEAVLPADVLPADDVRRLAIDVADAVDVLVVDGDPEGGADGGDAFYVTAALAPGGVATGLRPRLVSPEEMATTDLSGFAGVWLVDVPALSVDAIEALERYVRGGGGVVMFCGPRTRADVVSSTLHRGGAGFFPVPLAGAVDLLPSATGAATPDVVVEDHPVVAVLAGGRNPLLDAVRVERLWAVARGYDLDAAGCRRLLSVRTGQPLVVERAFGAGNVVAILTSAAPLWNSWARGNPSWVVVVLELQAHLARTRHAAGSVPVGGDVRIDLAAATDEPEVEFLVPPAGAVIRQTAVADAAGGLVARLPRVAVPGVYEARWRHLAGGGEARTIAVNVDADEGRLERAGRDGIARALAGVPFRYDRGDSFTEVDRDGSSSLAMPLLLAVVGLLLVEQLVACAAGYHSRPARARGS